MVFTICLITVNNYNLDKFEVTYENDTTITKNVFNGANVRCNKENDTLEVIYFVNTPENFKTVVGFYEKEFSGHLDMVLHKNGLKININYTSLISAVEELKEGKIEYTLKAKDLYPNSKFPDVSIVLYETKDADADNIRSCVNKLIQLKKDNQPKDAPKEAPKEVPKEAQKTREVEPAKVEAKPNDPNTTSKSELTTDNTIKSETKGNLA